MGLDGGNQQVRQKELDQRYEAMAGLNVKPSKDEIQVRNPAALGLDLDLRPHGR
jgi:hypothetical protein